MDTIDRKTLFAKLARRDHDRPGRTPRESLEILSIALTRIHREISGWTDLLIAHGFGWQHPLIEQLDATLVACGLTIYKLSDHCESLWSEQDAIASKGEHAR